MLPLSSATAAGVTVSLGLINFQVSVHSTVGEDTGSTLSNVCTHGHAPRKPRQTLVCPECGNAGDKAPMLKAREVGETLHVIPAEIIERAGVVGTEFKGQLDLSVHPADEVDAVLVPAGKVYYLNLKTPTKASLEAYAVMSALVTQRADLAFLARTHMRGATNLFRLGAISGGVMTLTMLADPFLVRTRPVLDLPEVSDRALATAIGVALDHAEPFTANTYAGGGKAEVFAQYLATVTQPETGDAPAPNLSLLAQLEAAASEDQPAPKVPAKRAAKRPAAKRPSAKVAS